MSRVVAMLLGAVLCASASAQEKLEVSQPEPATIRLGDAARVTLRVEGRDAAPRAPTLPEVDGLRMRLSAPARQSYTFYDGRRLVERVGVQYVLELKPERAGRFEVPPFPIWTGTKTQQTPALTLEARQDLVGAELGFLDVQVAPRRVYVHEPVRVRVDYGVLQGLRLVQDFHNRYRYLDVEVQASWLDTFPGGERLDVGEPQGDTRVAVCNQRLIRAGYDGDLEKDGKRWQRFSFERAFLPTRLGRIELAAPTLRFHVVQQGRVRGRASENFYVYGEPIELEVLPIPEEGRPSPYFGAVGRFSIAASLDRERVRQGDSVKLTLVVRGQGNLEFLRLPELDRLEGFHKLGEAEAQRTDEQVVVTYDLTPLSPDVTAVPPIGWNYFDTTPGVERFVEVETAALPLTVDAAEGGGGLAPLPGADAAAVTPGVDDIYDLPPLDGAPAVEAAPPAGWLRWLAVLLPWALVAAAFGARRAHRRARADVTGRRVRGAKRAFDDALRRGDDPLDAFAAYVGDRLDVPPAAVISPELQARLADSGLDDAVAAKVAAAVERGTAARYGGGAALDGGEVRALVDELEGARFGARQWLPLLLVPALWLGAAGPARAQAPVDTASDAVAAYRAGDYATADERFAAAYERTGDRRLLRARGNCLFRMGELAEARWAWECARLGLRRDDELARNLRLVRARLELPEAASGFDAELRRLLDRYTVAERVLACGALMLLGAGCLVFGWRRIGARWTGLALCLAATVLAVDVLWWTPSRPARAVALRDVGVTAEPRQDLEPVANVRAGALVPVDGGTDASFLHVEVAGRTGYAPADAFRLVR